MARSSEEGFRIFIDRLIPSNNERAKASSHRETIYNKLDDSFGLYRMFQSGSFKHGTGVYGHSDVDYFASLKTSRPQLSSSTLEAVRERLAQRFPNTHVHVSRPAVVLEFGQGYERVEVIPAYAQQKVGVHDDMKFWIPGVTTEWLESTPEAHLRYVNDCNQKPEEGKAKAFARLIKAWKYYRNVPISSFYLEMRAATYIARQSTVLYPYDLSFFLNELQQGGLAAMNDPTGSSGRIEPCSSDANKRDALSKLDTACGRASRALDYHKNNQVASAFEQWDLLFNGNFPYYG